MKSIWKEILGVRSIAYETWFLGVLWDFVVWSSLLVIFVTLARGFFVCG